MGNDYLGWVLFFKYLQSLVKDCCQVMGIRLSMLMNIVKSYRKTFGEMIELPLLHLSRNTIIIVD